MDSPHWSDALVELEACDEAVEWARTQPDLETAWRECRNGEWMIWLLYEIDSDERGLRLVACDCAEAVIHLVDGDSRDVCQRSLDVARRYAEGEASEEERDAAWAAAWAAARDAVGAAAWAAAWAATRATTRATAGAVAWAVAWDAARAVAWAVVGDAAWAAQSDIVRRHFPEAPELPGGGAYAPRETAQCLVPYAELPVEQRAKDFLFRGVVHALSSATE